MAISALLGAKMPSRYSWILALAFLLKESYHPSQSLYEETPYKEMLRSQTLTAIHGVTYLTPITFHSQINVQVLLEHLQSMTLEIAIDS